MNNTNQFLLTLINGNGKPYKIELPTIYIQQEHINDVALNHILENTGLKFKNTGYGYTAKPETPEQIVKLLMTYNWKTVYYNNASWRNIIFLKFNNENKQR